MDSNLNKSGKVAAGETAKHRLYLNDSMNTTAEPPYDEGDFTWYIACEDCDEDFLEGDGYNYPEDIEGLLAQLQADHDKATAASWPPDHPRPAEVPAANPDLGQRIEEIDRILQQVRGWKHEDGIRAMPIDEAIAQIRSIISQAQTETRREEHHRYCYKCYRQVEVGGPVAYGICPDHGNLDESTSLYMSTVEADKHRDTYTRLQPTNKEGD